MGWSNPMACRFSKSHPSASISCTLPRFRQPSIFPNKDWWHLRCSKVIPGDVDHHVPPPIGVRWCGHIKHDNGMACYDDDDDDDDDIWWWISESALHTLWHQWSTFQHILCQGPVLLPINAKDNDPQWLPMWRCFISPKCAYLFWELSQDCSNKHMYV